MSLFEPYVPEDFDGFWQEVVDAARAAPLDFHRSLQPESPAPGLLVEPFDFRGIAGSRLHGWFAYPEHVRRAPAFLWIPPYGRESLLPNSYGTRPGYASLSFNFFGHSAFHQEAYIPSRGYFAEGADDPESFVFRSMAQDAMIAARVLQAQIEVDEDRIGAMGMSQGGGMAIWLGAWLPFVKAVVADMPFLGAMGAALTRNAHRYPMKELVDYGESVPLGAERVLNTLSYFDTMNQATRCRVPTRVTLGEKDPAARPENVEAIYHALPGEKELVRLDIGHDWDPRMVEGGRRWLDRHLPTV
ncbi:MAG: acetylxylan esterase [Chthonomonadaceae bacterium]|nr:acetylxylan esterase [Chthonomonadaceae bacterium]